MNLTYPDIDCRIKKIILLTFILLAFSPSAFSLKEDNPPDIDIENMFFQARELAFEQKTDEAREICQDILDINADYHDASILMARTYAWESEYDEAITILDKVLEDEPGNLSAVSAIADVYIWDGKYHKAIASLDKVLESNPENSDLLFKKARALYLLEDYTPAVVLLNHILDQDPDYPSVDDLLAEIDKINRKNYIQAGYRGDYFDNLDPWHLYHLEYGRKTNFLGTVIGRVNYASRFNMQGVQFEADAYPVLANGTYLYLNAGYSPEEKLFPQFRAGFEVFHGLPSSWEASLGLRLLTFADNDLMILTGSVSKYFGLYYLSLRPYFTFASTGPNSQSVYLTARRYFSSRNHHLTLTIGTGYSADEDALVGGEVYNVDSRRLLLQYQQGISADLLIKAGAGWQHYREGIWGDKYTLELGVAYLF